MFLVSLPNEVRALWVVRTSMTSPESVRQVVTLAERFGFNTLVAQVRGRGDAYYRSSLEPRAESLASQPSDFDPLGYLLELAEPLGIQVHAWMNVFYVWSSPQMPRSSNHLVVRRPQWIARDRNNRYQMTTRGRVEGVYMCPSNPNLRTHTLKVFAEVARRYPQLSGLHLDYVRYPNEEYCYCSGCLARFRASLYERLAPERAKALDRQVQRGNRLAWVKAFPSEWDDWRREQVSLFVSAFQRQSRQADPKLILSAAVWPQPTLARQRKLQDWQYWFQKGWLDVLFPMAYDRDTGVFEQQIRTVLALAGERPVVAGIGAWQISAESALNKIRVARQLGARGFCLFSYDGITRGGADRSYLMRLKLD